jgi:glycosyltransferase involved in cell wall biosynthesis
MPAVSVIIAVKNAEKYLRECLDSVSGQTFDSYEILVIDGRSTDGTEAIARSYNRVTFFQQDGVGFADAWNCGLRKARGEFMTFIDSDDIWTPHKLERQVALLRNDPRLEGVIGKVRFVPEPGKNPPRGFHERVFARDHTAYMPGVLMARRRLFDYLGDWGEGWVVANDIDWFLKLKDSGLPIGIVEEVLLQKRIHNTNFSSIMAANSIYPREILRLLRSSILRKRQAQD